MSDTQLNSSLPSTTSPAGKPPAAAKNLYMDQAYARVAAELAAIPDDELVRLNVDPAVATSIILDRLPALRSLRAAWLETMPSFDIASLDRLEDYALALLYTHSLIAIVEDVASDLPEDYENALAQRDALLSTAKTLSAYGLLDASRFERIGLDRGYRNVGVDLQSLVAMFQQEWPRIGHRCPFDVTEIELARERSNAMVRGSVERARVPGPLTPSLKERQRAFTALNRAYDDVRRAVSFLRWQEEDASTFAPGLVSGGRGTSRRPANRDGDEAATEPSKLPMKATDSPSSEPEPEDTHGKDSLFAAPAEI